MAHIDSSDGMPETGKRGSRPPTSTDVARRAGVSQKTVSRVLNDEPYVSDEVRERVLAAVSQLGYRRNLTAAALNRGRSRRIGLVSLGTSLWGPATLLLSIERAVRRAGYTFTVISTLEGDEGGISGVINELLEQGVDGIVLLEPIDSDPDLAFVTAPILSFGRIAGVVGPHVIEAGPDAQAGASAATEHLLSLGHRTVWHVAGPQRWFSAQDRLLGWQRALEMAGAEIPPHVEGDWSPASGYAAGRYLATMRDLTAVFVANDDMAIGLIRALRDHGVEVPGQVSVVGYDDIPTSAYLSPQLTTVRQDFEAAAPHGLAQLLQEIEGTSKEDRLPARPLPVQLVVRQSTAPPPTCLRGRHDARHAGDEEVRLP
jgi:DNA-binding LacI/PurR family transcriptional regulator